LAVSAEQGPPAHFLVINLGVGGSKTPTGYQETTYRFSSGAGYSASVAGLALWRWLVDTQRPPEGVLFACTSTAWEERAAPVALEAVRLGLRWQGMVDHVDLEVPRSQEQVWAVLPPLEDWLRSHGVEASRPAILHLDLTHAFRAIPLAHTWLALYLQRRGIAAAGVWGYGAYDPARKEETPYLDLSHLLSLADWAEAVGAFHDRFDTGGVARLLDPLERAARHGAWAAGDAHPRGELGALLRAAEAAGRAFRAGLPLEAGLAAREHLGGMTVDTVRRAAGELLPHHAPLAEELFLSLEPVAVRSTGREAAKQGLVLDQAEILRQFGLVGRWKDAGMIDAALRGLRELVVSRVLLARGSGPGEWLTRSSRSAAEGRLNGLAAKPPARQLTEREEALAGLWRGVRDRRNPLAHAGMQRDAVNVVETRRALGDQLLPSFRKLDEDGQVWRLEGIPERREEEALEP
jgi:hypothetical protein